MRLKHYLKTGLATLVALMCVGGGNALAQEKNYSAVLDYDYSTDAQVATWVSANTGRYTINSGEVAGSKCVIVTPVSTGNNGTTATTQALNGIGTSYTSSNDFKVEFDFNISGNGNQASFFDVYDTDGKVLVSFKQTTANNVAGTVNASDGSVLGSFTFFKLHTQPTSFCHVVITGNETDGTKMVLTPANETDNSPVTYTLAKEVKHVGKLVYNTKRYYGHFIFSNLKASIAVASDYVPAPTATVTGVNGASRTITITPADDAAEGTNILYYTSSDDAADASKHITYTEPFTTSDATSIYYYASYNGKNSDVKELTTTAGTDAKLATPTITRTGENAYTIAANATTVDGIVADQTLHYTVAGGEEQTSTNAAVELTGVTGDLTAYATSSNGFTQSESASEAFVAPYEGATAWAYNLNSYPSTYGVTSIADAIDTTTVATLNGLQVYNLKEIKETYPDLYVENSKGWLLRNLNRSAFKAQTAKASIAINNVTTNDMISINAVNDYGRNPISNVTNGETSYSYDNTYFIKPTADGAVTVTFNTGVSVNTVSVLKNTQTVNINTDSHLASFCSTSTVTVPDDVLIYIATKNDENTITLNSVDTKVIPANTGVILYSETTGDKTLTIGGTANDEYANNIFKAATVATPAGDNTYALAKGQQYFAKVKSGVVIPAGKAYLELDTTNSSKLNISFGDETTGINKITSEDAQSMNAPMYNLAGQRVSKSFKGIVIQNGKKFINK